jgi:large subunit ribosomal protein L13
VKTTTVPVSAPKWFVIDATGQSLGKIAVKAASILRGKHKASFAPHQLCGDCIIVLNAGKIALPAKKTFRKTYYRHTGYPGNMKITGLAQMLERKPQYVIEHAVTGMLESNRLSKLMMKRLHVFAGNEHPYEAQKPEVLTLTPKKAK